MLLPFLEGVGASPETDPHPVPQMDLYANSNLMGANSRYSFTLCGNGLNTTDSPPMASDRVIFFVMQKLREAMNEAPLAQSVSLTPNITHIRPTRV